MAEPHSSTLKKPTVVGDPSEVAHLHERIAKLEEENSVLRERLHHVEASKTTWLAGALTDYPNTTGVMPADRQTHYREAELEALLEVMPVGVAIAYDTECKQMRANRAFCEMLGIDSTANPSKTGDTASDLPFRVMRNGEEIPPEELPMQVVARTGLPLEHTECEVLRNDGTRIFMHGYTRPLFDEEGRLRGSIGAFFDDTERVSLMLELARSNDELERFAYAAGHDLQEPLLAIGCFAELLTRNPRPEEIPLFNQRIQAAVARMRELIRGILEYARVRNNGGPGSGTYEVDCNTALEYAVQNLHSAIQESRAVITHDPLPVVTCQGQFLVQVFQNLISNSIKYRGADLPRIHVSVQEGENECTFSVRDNGIGFEMSQSRDVFRLFRQLDPNRSPGAGVGLAICKQLIERNGGRIFVESAPGSGSTFFFTIPRAKGSRAVPSHTTTNA